MFAKSAAFLCGTLLVCQLPSLAPLTGLAPILYCGLALLAWRRAALWAFLMAGILWTWQFGAAALAHGLDPALNGREWLVTGDVSSVPQLAIDHASFDLSLTEAPPAIARLRRLRLAWYEAGVDVRAGERWRLLVRVRHAHGLRNPGDYDFEGRLFGEGIDAIGYVVRCPCNGRIGRATWRSPVLRAREWIAARIASAAPRSPYLGIVQDLAVGLGDRVSPEQWQVFSATGTTHLMAISGFHIAGVALLAMWLVRFGWRVIAPPRGTRADLESVIGMAAAVAYALLAGFSVPTQRTLVTLACVLGARLIRRSTAIWDLLGLALLGVLLLDPLASLGAGFWLSFATVAGILFALQGRVVRRSEWRDLVPAQAAATLCLLPLTLALFGTVAVLGPLVNLVAIPVFSLLLVPAVLAGVALLAVPGGIAEMWFRLIERAIATAWPGFEMLANSSMAIQHVSERPAWTLALLAVGVLWMLAPWPLLLRLMGLALALPVVSWHPPALAHGAFDLTVLDVGQGLSTYVATREHALLFDTGPASKTGRAAAEFSIVPFLRSRARTDLDVLVLSHSDRDHVGGAQAVRRAVRVLREFVGGDLRGHQADACRAGETWIWDDVRFRFLHPPAGPSAGGAVRENDASCVLLISGPGGSVLLTGDIETAAEQALIGRSAVHPVDTVVVPHHGSRTSSGVEFVAALAPRWALVSAGYDNRWNFPKREVVERWQASGATTLSTSQSGAITLHFGATGLTGEPEEYRRTERRFWHVD